ncbi:hypothetical protein Y032_0095g2794 [Ancylostoma ceylanicum]|uniref:Uncharacterized protein n=1 Tax=Ancylostoma ceylanicum TaxID=53326 RepID=A0A016TKB9_9BILA|nr:hypothetical protein Y032_0095g2794 [Ancylostoma ceylanicum]
MAVTPPRRRKARGATAPLEQEPLQDNKLRGFLDSKLVFLLANIKCDEQVPRNGGDDMIVSGAVAPCSFRDLGWVTAIDAHCKYEHLLDGCGETPKLIRCCSLCNLLDACTAQ